MHPDELDKVLDNIAEAIYLLKSDNLDVYDKGYVDALEWVLETLDGFTEDKLN